MEKTYQEQESLIKSQLIKKNEEEDDRLAKEVALMKRQAELSLEDQRMLEREAKEKEIIRRREAERARREEMDAQQVNLMAQHEEMKSFQKTFNIG